MLNRRLTLSGIGKRHIPQLDAPSQCDITRPGNLALCLCFAAGLDIHDVRIRGQHVNDRLVVELKGVELWYDHKEQIQQHQHRGTGQVQNVDQREQRPRENDH